MKLVPGIYVDPRFPEITHHTVRDTAGKYEPFCCVDTPEIAAEICEDWNSGLMQHHICTDIAEAVVKGEKKAAIAKNWNGAMS